MKSVCCLFFLILFLSFGCEDQWDKRYSDQLETVNENMWDNVQNASHISRYAEIAEELGFDSLFSSAKIYTLFIPDNDAINTYENQYGAISIDILEYHISNQFIQSRSVKGKKPILTLLEKFALFENNEQIITYDQIEIVEESPLFLNGKYFVISSVAVPGKSIFNYLLEFNTILANYISSQDSSIMDYENSKPLLINDEGEVVYDSVIYIYNEFEELFFPVRRDFRARAATFVLPGNDNYHAALDQMAQKIGGNIIDHQDIPLIWQNEVLIPYLFKQGSFNNRLEVEEFFIRSVPEISENTYKIRNILGDSILIGYVPTNQYLCSNGYVYDYAEFTIPDSLYLFGSRYEGEWLLDNVGFNKFAWNDRANVSSSISLIPLKEYIANLSNDSVAVVEFPSKFNGSFSIEFTVKNVFPGKYAAIVSTHMDIGGIYDIYINDQLVKTFDYYEFALWRGFLPSILGGRNAPFPSNSRFNRFDFWVEDILTEFGDVKVKFVYTGPGDVAGNGFFLDYFRLMPF
jgi:hypothetical protein